MSETDLRILKHKDGGGAVTPAPVGVPGDKFRVSMGKQVLGYFNNIRYWDCQGCGSLAGGLIICRRIFLK